MSGPSLMLEAIGRERFADPFDRDHTVCTIEIADHDNHGTQRKTVRIKIGESPWFYGAEDMLLTLAQAVEMIGINPPPDAAPTT